MLAIAALALILVGVFASGPIKRYARGLVAGTWRPGAGTFGVAFIFGGLISLLRAAVVPGLVLIGLGLLLVMAARARKGDFRWPGAGFGAQPPTSGGNMSRTDAAAILGVPVDAERAAVLAAHRRLIRMAHPDAGGTPSLAAQLNQARDVLLRA